jgi:membrane protease YdiL (CAAX protease family)
MFGGGIGGLLVALLLGGVVAPVAEEVFFRGFIYAGLRARWGVGWALAVTSAVFALVHLTPGVFPPLFLMGLLLAYLYERSDSLWPSILLHAAINSIAFIGMYVSR